MGYGQRLRVQRTADVRVLKSQLDLIAEVARSGRLVSPAWAVWVAFVTSSAVGYFGHNSFWLSATLPVLIGAIAYGGYNLSEVYSRDTPARR